MSKQEKIRGVRGMNDVLPADEARWRQFDDVVQQTFSAYAYGRIRTPILEHTRLFVRGIGEVTDIVEKEMYSFTDALNGEQLSLRPENTAAVVRAAIEHNLTYNGPQRLWYSGPMFRHERPQKGRYRQFHQVGAEVLGAAGPEVDAELIILGQRLWDDLGIDNVRLEINCLGQADERLAHREALIAYFEAHHDQLDDDARRRLHTNPLRILDTKNPKMQAMVDGAPSLADYLGDESRGHFEAVQRIVRSRNIPFRVNSRLVRGLDYYNLTVFEWVYDDLTLCGGGRYDPLIEMIGGKPSYGCGFAIGVERVLEVLRELGSPSGQTTDIYVVHFGERVHEVAMDVAERLRDSGLNVLMHTGTGGAKAQFRRADASGAFAAVVIGTDEAESGQVGVKWLRDSAREQSKVSVESIAQFIHEAMLD